MSKQNGQTWISGKTNQLRYKVGEKDRYIQPTSIYTAGEAIKRGHVVSLNTTSNTVVKTDTSIYKKAIGIAAATTSIGNDVHVIPFGFFRFDEVAFADGGYIPSFTSGDIGKQIYVSSSSGELTTSLESAELNNRWVIEVGTLTASDGIIHSIELSLEGDGRGPTGYTQLEYTLGEDIYVKSTVDPIVLAMGNKVAANNFAYSLEINGSITPTVGSWFSFYSSTKAIFFIFDSDSATLNLDEYQVIANATSSQVVVNLATIGFSGLYNTALSNSICLANKILTELTVHRDLLTVANSYLTVANNGTNWTGVTDNTSNVIISVINNIAGGPIYFKASTSASTLFAGSIISDYGNFANNGKAIVADKSTLDDSRNNVIGFLNIESNTTRIIPTGTNVLIARQGRLNGFQTRSGSSIGSKLYLGSAGGTLENLASFNDDDYIVELGSVYSATEVDVDIKSGIQKLQELPVGNISMLPNGTTNPDHGYLLCNGVSVLKADYPELNTFLGRQTPTYPFGSDSTHFTLPNLNQSSEVFQIKYKSLGSLSITPPVWRKQFSGIVGSELTANGVSSFNINPYDDPEWNISSGSLENLIVKLSIDIDGLGTYTDIPAGYDKMDSNVYGYLIEKESSNSIKVVTGSSGLYYRNFSGNATSLNGKAFVLTVYKPELFLQYRNLDETTTALVTNPNTITKNGVYFVKTYSSLSNQDTIIEHISYYGTGLYNNSIGAGTVAIQKAWIFNDAGSELMDPDDKDAIQGSYIRSYRLDYNGDFGWSSWLSTDLYDASKLQVGLLNTRIIPQIVPRYIHGQIKLTSLCRDLSVDGILGTVLDPIGVEIASQSGYQFYTILRGANLNLPDDFLLFLVRGTYINKAGLNPFVELTAHSFYRGDLGIEESPLTYYAIYDSTVNTITWSSNKLGNNASDLAIGTLSTDRYAAISSSSYCTTFGNNTGIIGAIGTETINTNFSVAIPKTGRYLLIGRAFISVSIGSYPAALSFVKNSNTNTIGMAGAPTILTTSATPAYVTTAISLTGGDIIKLKICASARGLIPPVTFNFVTSNIDISGSEIQAQWIGN